MTVVLSELIFMEIKVQILGAHIDILVDNMLSGRNDHLEPSGMN